MPVLDNFLSNLGAYWPLTVFVLLWPFLVSLAILAAERHKHNLGFDALYVGIATYLGGIPVPGEIVPRTCFGRTLVVVNRIFGIFAFGYLLAALVLALNQPARLPW